MRAVYVPGVRVDEARKQVENKIKDNITARAGKKEVGKPGKLLGTALAAESTRTRGKACKDVEVEKVKHDKLEGKVIVDKPDELLGAAQVTRVGIMVAVGQLGAVGIWPYYQAAGRTQNRKRPQAKGRLNG